MQKLEKERRLIEQAQQEKEEFDRILRVQREAEEAEQAAKVDDCINLDETRCVHPIVTVHRPAVPQAKKQHTSQEHMYELQAQILMNAEEILGLCFARHCCAVLSSLATSPAKYVLRVGTGAQEKSNEFLG